jgi:vancomycin aglycone glucosyltransferase
VRIAIAVDGTRGDVHPMIALGLGLSARGHEVLLCAPPDFREDAEGLGLDFRSVGIPVRSYLAAQASFLHGGPLASLGAGLRYFRDSIERQFRELVPAVSGADWVLAASTQLAAASAAESVGARHRFIAYCPSLFRSPHQTPFAIPRATLRPWQNRLAWAATVRLFGGALWGVLTRERARLGLAPARDAYALFRGEAPALAAEELLAPPPADLRGEVRVVGCLLPFDPEPLPAKLETFLDAGEPPLYLGFGSMTDPDPAAATRMLLEAVDRAGVRAVVAEGWAGLGAGPLSESVIAIGAVSHAALFPRVAAVVHHGGAGTTTTAARAGAPQVVVPHVLDQFHWAQRVAAAGVAPPPLPRRRLDATGLAGAIRATLDNELLRERARELGIRLRDALRTRPDPESALLDLDR